jgi:hypothetical protein
VTLNIPSFFFLCLAGIIFCRLARTINTREIALLGVNSLALSVALTSPEEAISHASYTRQALSPNDAGQDRALAPIAQEPHPAIGVLKIQIGRTGS